MRTPANSLRVNISRSWRNKSVYPRLNNVSNYFDRSIVRYVARKIRAYQRRKNYGLIFSHAIIKRYLNRWFHLNIFCYDGWWMEKVFHRRRLKKKFWRIKKEKWKHFFRNPTRNISREIYFFNRGSFRRTHVRKRWFKRRYKKLIRRRRWWRHFLIFQLMWRRKFWHRIYETDKNSRFKIKFTFFEGRHLSAESIVMYIIGSLTNRFRVTSTTYRLIKGLRLNIFTGGLMVQASGRFTRRQMTSYQKFKEGAIAVSRFSSRTRYARGNVTQKYSVCGLKVWVPPLYIPAIIPRQRKEMKNDGRGTIYCKK